MATLVVVFEEGTQHAKARGLLHARGLASEAGQHCRWHEPTVATIDVDPGRSDVVAELRELPAVCRATMIVDGRGLFDDADAKVRLSNGACFGEGLVVIAGPCSIEGEAHALETAMAVKDTGAHAMRGGVFKPRTSPYCFGGLGEAGLAAMVRAREKTGLPIVTEALDSAQLDLVARRADIIQIGARNMHNSALLYRAGRHPSRTPVLLKRGFGATIEELVDAAEYVLLGRFAAGASSPGLVLCERGLRTFDRACRYTLDISAIPVLHERCRLPVIIDPSHPAGNREYVAPLARAAVAAGADGLLIEVHPNPDRAWSDGRQCVGVPAFRDMMRQLERIARAIG